MDKPNTRWEFVRLSPDPEAWIWECVTVDGRTVKATETCESFGKIMVDAVRNGFSSGTQHWSIVNDGWRTEFAPGVEPKTTRTNPGTTSKH